MTADEARSNDTDTGSHGPGERSWHTPGDAEQLQLCAVQCAGRFRTMPSVSSPVAFVVGGGGECVVSVS